MANLGWSWSWPCLRHAYLTTQSCFGLEVPKLSPSSQLTLLSSTRRHTYSRCQAALAVLWPALKARAPGFNARRQLTKMKLKKMRWKFNLPTYLTFKLGCIWPTLPTTFLCQGWPIQNHTPTSISIESLSRALTCRCRTVMFSMGLGAILSILRWEKVSQVTTANFTSLLVTLKKRQSSCSSTRRKFWSFKLVDTTDLVVLIRWLTSLDNKRL